MANSGAGNGLARLTDELVIAIRRRGRKGEAYADIAADLGVSTATVRFAATGNTWTHLNDQYPPVPPRHTSGKNPITPEIRAGIRRRLAEGASIKAVAREFNVTWVRVRAIANGVER